jgi:hypothetical protein
VKLFPSLLVDRPLNPVLTVVRLENLYPYLGVWGDGDGLAGKSAGFGRLSNFTEKSYLVRSRLHFHKPESRGEGILRLEAP